MGAKSTKYKKCSIPKTEGTKVPAEGTPAHEIMLTMGLYTCAWFSK